MQEQGFRLTGEQVAFGFAFLMVTTILLIFTHSWITTWFLNEQGQKDMMTHFSAWVMILIFVSVSLLISYTWWFNYDGTGLRPVVQHWLTSAGWNIR
jgi:hypothetical protein